MYVISMEFLSPSRRCSSLQNVPSRQEQGEMAVFAGNALYRVGLRKCFDILSISDTWFNSSVTNASVEIPGYRIFRLHHIGKTGAGVWAYIKSALKVTVLKDLTGITESGLHKLWIQVQNKKLRSLLVCTINL